MKYETKELKEFDLLENIKKDIKSVNFTLGVKKFTPSMLKNNNHVFIFAGVPYYDIGGGQRCSQITKTFNKMGYLVDYIYAYESCETKKFDLILPTNRHIYLNDIESSQLLNGLSGEPIFIFEIPHKGFEPYIKLAKKIKAKIVYEHIDNWETQLGNLFFNKDVFKIFLEHSDLVIATSELLKQKLEKFIAEENLKCGEVKYLANAVDSELFDCDADYTKPKDLVFGEKTLLYYGSLWGDWLEWDKIIYVAENYKACSINIIGDFEPIKDKIKDMPKNMYFLGLKKQTELPKYLNYVDFALLPFKNDDIGKYVSPLKIFEYISMNKMVIATKLPDIQGYPNVLSSDDKEGWLKFIKGETKLQSIDKFIYENNWYSRCNFILNTLSMISEENSEKFNISIVILNRNNKNVIFKCISNLILYRIDYEYEIIIVDNESTDGSYEKLIEDYSGYEYIKIIKNNKNGCSSGRNLGVKNSSGNLILFLDSDQWPVSEKWLDVCINIIYNNKNIGAVSWAAGWFNKKSIAGVIGEHLPNRGINPNYLYRTDIGYLGTGGMILKKETFYEVDGFDENYDPTCYEDTDFSLKIRYAGYELAYCTYINITHRAHQTTQSGSKSHAGLMKRNAQYFCKKWEKINPNLMKIYYNND